VDVEIAAGVGAAPVDAEVAAGVGAAPVDVAAGVGAASAHNGDAPAPRDSYDDCDFSSGSEVSTDEEDDRFHGYRKLPLPKGSDLRVKYHGNVYMCPVCPGKAHRWFSEESIRGHVVGQGTSAALREVYKKKWSRHRVLARNHGWM
jgi:hypothetical protein